MGIRQSDEIERGHTTEMNENAKILHPGGWRTNSKQADGEKARCGGQVQGGGMAGRIGPGGESLGDP